MNRIVYGEMGVWVGFISLKIHYKILGSDISKKVKTIK